MSFWQITFRLESWPHPIVELESTYNKYIKKSIITSIIVTPVPIMIQSWIITVRYAVQVEYLITQLQK